MPSKLIATSFALIAFAIALIAGIAADNPASTALVRALLAMAICYVVGWLLGMVATKATGEHIEAYRQAHPIDETDGQGSAAEDSDRPASGSPDQAAPTEGASSAEPDERPAATQTAEPTA